MGDVRIYTEVLNTINKSKVKRIICPNPNFPPKAVGEKSYVLLKNVNLDFTGPEPKVIFDYYVSLEYQFEFGYDYCIGRGNDFITLPEGFHLCSYPVDPVLTYSAACEEFELVDGVIKAIIRMDLSVVLCQYQTINVKPSI
ncbi:hypothetical protein Dred_1412 [Desulforamulus reducens MI-1]|uniref:Uncharacterized protein n=1 Tax=Desulforamulus reducens (strain ATCC BAA-1160 / DSM 100696 / MI-1) TaxID=349161 RepID=A4J4D9_DESRM|nr:hypothetical protein [Desulforamulus reducens]ABO49942.1 hypothetical protein Dred_1412 [Desulforamulus reducens MI-1]